MNSRFEIKSFNFVTWNWQNDVNVEAVKKEIDYQKEVCNVNTITFAFAAVQEHCFSIDIDWKGKHMPKHNELVQLVEYAKERELKTIIKPMINVKDGYWRAYIRFFDEDVPCEPKWSEWFRSYNEYLLAYGEFCEKNNVDMFVIGCELVGTDHRQIEWRYLISELRKIYSGKLTYNCDKYQEHNIKWWDALDYISSSGYYPKDNISKEFDRIEKVSKEYNKPFFFTEAGCPSVIGASKVPNDWTVISNGKISEDEQYDYYKEFFEESERRDFIYGFCLWDWPMNSPKILNNKYNGDYSIKYKKTEKLIKEYYSK